MIDYYVDTYYDKDRDQVHSELTSFDTVTKTMSIIHKTEPNPADDGPIAWALTELECMEKALELGFEVSNRSGGYITNLRRTVELI